MELRFALKHILKMLNVDSDNMTDEQLINSLDKFAKQYLSIKPILDSMLNSVKRNLQEIF